MSIQTAWGIVARRNGLSKKQARRTFPRVLEHAVEHHEVVRQALAVELDQELEAIATAEAMVDLEVAVAMADFDEQAARLAGDLRLTSWARREQGPPIQPTHHPKGVVNDHRPK
jgi:hypothetical protein